MKTKVLVPVARGSEELEAVTVIDLMRRAGFAVTVAGENDIITCSRGVKLIPDVLIDNLEKDDNWDAIVLPGGLGGSEALAENPVIGEILTRHNELNKLIAAICAAPTILARLRLIAPDTEITSHPSVSSQLASYNYHETNVVKSRNLITGRAAGCAIEFTLEIIKALASEEMADNIATDILYLQEG